MGTEIRAAFNGPDGLSAKPFSKKLECKVDYA